MKDHPIFILPQRSLWVLEPLKFQILVLLKYLGSKVIAASSSSSASHFQILKGTNEKYRKRAAQAVMLLEANLYHWPGQLECRMITTSIKKRFSPNFAGFMDATLLPLECKPKLQRVKFYSWKGFFSINMLIICNHNAHIIYYMVRRHGSVHNNCDWNNWNMCWIIGETILMTTIICWLIQHFHEVRKLLRLSEKQSEGKWIQIVSNLMIC